MVSRYMLEKVTDKDEDGARLKWLYQISIHKQPDALSFGCRREDGTAFPRVSIRSEDVLDFVKSGGQPLM
jgi:hypothetical protein